MSEHPRVFTVGITGASGAFGRAIAELFAQEGADLVISDIDEFGLQETARTVSMTGREVLALNCDVTKRSSVEFLIDQTINHFGRFTTMIANAGVAQTAPFLEMTDEDWSRVISVNITGVFLCDQIAAQRLVACGDGGNCVGVGAGVANASSTWARAVSARSKAASVRL